jgi:tRNA threonylcarbamoyl adenosine modification protein YeaZ
MALPLVLALDGSTRVCGAALLTPGAGAGAGADAAVAWQLVAERREADNRGQAKLLLGMVDDMLSEVGLQPGDLGAVVVGIGPGTFTGVRIAVATARALGLALPVPVTGVSTLSALAASGAAGVAAREAAAPGVRKLVPVVDARRGQVFYGVYDRGADAGTWVRSEPFAVCDPSDLGRSLAAGMRPGTEILVISEDATLVGEFPDCVSVAVETVDPARLVLGQEALNEPGDGPEGRRLRAWLADAVSSKASGAPELVKPIYVRSPDADIHIMKMKDPWSESPAPPARRDSR